MLGKLDEATLAFAVNNGFDLNKTFETCSGTYDGLLMLCDDLYYFDKQLEVLILAGADVNVGSFRSNIAKNLTLSHTIAHVAVSAADHSNLSLLIAAGANINVIAKDVDLWDYDEHDLQSFSYGQDCSNSALTIAMLHVSGGVAYKECGVTIGPTPMHVALRKYQRNVMTRDITLEQIVNSIEAKTFTKALEMIAAAHERLQEPYFRFIKKRASEICMALQGLALDANRLCYIVTEACAPHSFALDFHRIWNLVCCVKHFH